jgi:hypothetical protein
MRKQTVGYLLATSLLASACSLSGGDDIWMPDGASGKADGYTTIKGSDIPSAYVSANKYYIVARNIDNLTAVGALDQAQTALAKRVDGIIANMPANGAMHLAELVRMEDPTIFGSLFPAEKTALPKLWKLAEAPDSDTLLAGTRDNFGVVDSSLPPAAAVPPASLAITTLATELQAPASRLENVYNSDNNAGTVTLADLTGGVANPASFTPDEVVAFAKIQAVFREQAVAQSDSNLVVSPGPGETTKDEMLGPVKFHMTGLTKIDEQRSSYSTQLTIVYNATQALAATATLTNGAQVIAINQESAAEVVFGDGAVPSFPGGDYTFEVWQGGQRTFSTNADLPTLTATTTIPLNDKLDYTLTSGLAPLVRNLTSATLTSSQYVVHYTYDKTAQPPPASIIAAAVTATTTPTVKLAVGRFTFPQSGASLLVYPNNVLWFNNRGALSRLLPVGNNGSAPTRFAGPNITFDAAASQIYCSQCSPAVNVRLDNSMRDI